MTISALAGASMSWVMHLTKGTGLPRSQLASRYSSMPGGSGAELHHIWAGSPPRAMAQGIRSCLWARASRSWSAPPLCRCQCIPSVRSSNFCRRYMPTLRAPLTGSRVMTCGRVMYGPPSSGQQVRMGSRSSDGSSVMTTSWHGARRTRLGPRPMLCSAASISLPRFIIAPIPCGRRGSTSLPSLWRTSSRSSTPRARAIRRAEPKALISTGMVLPATFSKSSALFCASGPLLTRSVISVISR